MKLGDRNITTSSEANHDLADTPFVLVPTGHSDVSINSGKHECSSFMLIIVHSFLTFFDKIYNVDARRYWFVILVALSLVILVLPAPVLYYRSRRWLVRHLARLALAFIYPVTFADFFIGDMFCSLAYSMGNIEVFFCLYARSFQEPTKCSSSNSRILGFFNALPAIWRALQCLRRYNDSKAWMPHIPNFGKYCATCLMYATLSLFRTNENITTEAIFITCAIVNSIYTIFWDIKLDWSLGNMSAGGLREDLTFRKQPWIYWVAMIEDAILRFNWIMYVVSWKWPQHSSAISFFVALSEVIRRGIWIVFRVENEHWGNVRLTQAYRDPPLPFKVALEMQPDEPTVASGTGADMERVISRTQTMPMTGLRNRNPTGTLNRTVSARSVLDDAHMFDYQRSDSFQSDSSTSEEDEDEDRDR